MQETTDLVQVGDITTEIAAKIYTEGGLKPFYEQVREKVAGVTADVSTPKGRAAIASLAMKVSRSKTAVEKPGREYLRKLKEMPKAVEAELRDFIASMDALRDEVRAPLNEWEAAESRRKEAHIKKIAEMTAQSQVGGLTSAEIKKRLEYISGIQLGQRWEEFEAEAASVKSECFTVLTQAFDAAVSQEAQAAELEKLRKEAAEREQAVREARIAKEAEARAKAEAEKEIARVKMEAELAEQKRIAAVKQAELDKIEAARQQEVAIQRAKEQAEAEARAEQERVERERADREADVKHRRNINRAAVDAIVKQVDGLTSEQAKAVVSLVAQGKIPNITIKY